MYRLWIRILDNDGDTSTATFNIPDTNDYDDVLEFADAFIPLVDAVVLGEIQEAGISFSLTLPGGLKATPGVGCDVQNGALFSFATTGGYRTSVRLPSFDTAMYGANSKDVDTEDADVAAFTQAMISGIVATGGTVSPSDYRGDDINALVKAVQSFRK
jgi:hypothetical protein